MSTFRMSEFRSRPAPVTERGPDRPGPAAQADPRESMRVLPSVLALPLTLLTGKPLAGQRPLRLSPTVHLAGAVGSLGTGLTLSTHGTRAGGAALLLLLPGWVVTLHGMRNLRMMIYHQCSHRNLYRRRRLDATLGRLVAALLLVQGFTEYRREHVTEHHAAHHMTLRDPTVQAFLVSLALRPGMTRQQMWRRVLGKLTSPVFHLRFSVSRLHAFVHGSSRGERAAAAVLYAAAGTVATVTGGWALLLTVWVCPLGPLFQVSNTLRLCVKHTFPAPSAAPRRGAEYFGNLTNAVFLGEAVPVPGGRAPRRWAAWLRWTLRMLLIHAPARYLVVTGDTVCHDYHHRHPSSRQWFNYIFARQRDVDAGHPGWPPYREVWGLVPAINAVFDSLSVADPAVYDRAKITTVSGRQLFAAFDD